MKNRYIAIITTLVVLWTTTSLFAHDRIFAGTVTANNEVLVGATVSIPAVNKGRMTDAEGYFEIKGLKEGRYLVKINYLGYMTITDSITITHMENLVRNYTMQEDLLNLSEVVVTGTRSMIERYNSSIIINTISNRTFEATQSLSIAEGLSFSPGLRVENNCQNCGFTQLRMNGLEGAYSQILINSRPVFSALAGVYGLEMLPPSMVDRVEVVRGGGSVLYGGNAIAGTVNIITRAPIKNTFEVGINQSFINFESSDRTVHFNGALVSKDLNKGISFFGFNRTRDPWDANGDDFSEMVKLRNNTFGFDAFWKTSERSKIQLGTYYINEFRRGGNKFDLYPHQTDVTEQLKHNIVNANASFEIYSKNYKHKFAIYSSVQHVNRDSYYGGGGRVIVAGDSLTADDILAINAYGTSTDLSVVGGIQYNFDISKKFLFTAGAEYVHNNVKDAMPGYARLINQRVGTMGTYLQLQYKPIEKLTFLVGGRYDHVAIDGSYDLMEEQYVNKTTLNVFVPRISAMYTLARDLKLRASFAQGYRGPQAFDEDLHIETVGGAARFVQIDQDLIEERSNSALLSLNFDKYIKKWQLNFVLEGFYTYLDNPFVFSDQTELPNGVSVTSKRNGAGATVAGANLEANIAFSNKIVLQSGMTVQVARYAETEEIWAPENNASAAVATDKLLRTPDAYGYFSLIYKPIKNLSIAYTGVVTGSMDVPHVINAETEETVIKTTPTFFENNLKVDYTIQFKKNFYINIFAGVQNIFNQYQSDFDLGAERDAGYIYGPMRPRTVFMGLKFGLN